MYCGFPGANRRYDVLKFKNEIAAIKKYKKRDGNTVFSY